MSILFRITEPADDTASPSAIITARKLAAFRRFLRSEGDRIGIALLDTPGQGSGTAVDVGCRDGKLHPAELVEMPFYDKAAEIPRGKLVDIPNR